MLDISGVDDVWTLMTGTRNVLVTAVGNGIDEITGIAAEIDRRGLAIDQEILIRSSGRRPLGRFELEM